MASQLLTIQMITPEAMRVLENNIMFAKMCDRQYDKRFGVDGAKIGDTLNLRKPIRSIGRTGQALQLEDMIETSVPLVLTTQFGVDMALTSRELALEMDFFSERVLKPNVATVANKIDYDLAQTILTVPNEIGTPGTIPNSLFTYLSAGALLDNEACPRDDERSIVYSPYMQATIVDTLKGLFNDTEDVAEQYRTGRMARGAGYTWAMDQNIPAFTVGTQGGTPVVNGANQTGNAIITNGWSHSTQVLNAGDVIQFAGSNGVNPQNRQSYGTLRWFVVTAPVTSDGSGNATIPISGPSGLGIIVSGQFQTVTASPTNGGAITVNGASGINSPRGCAFHREAFTIGCADLPLYDQGVVKAARISDDQAGFSIRMITAYDINLDRCPTRLDFLYGVLCKYPELACRIAS